MLPEQAACSVVPGYSHQKLSIFGCRQIFKAYPESRELLLKIAVPEAPVVILRKNKGVIQLTATAEVVVIHPHDVQKSLCLLNIVCMKEQPVQKFLLQFPLPAWQAWGCR